MKRGLALSIALLVGCTASEAPNVAAPPAIVFDWLRNGNRDIYRAMLDGTDTVRLTSDLGDDQYPTERAGTVVFTSYRDGKASCTPSRRPGAPSGALRPPRRTRPSRRSRPTDGTSRT